jgi:hypothetical protein
LKMRTNVKIFQVRVPLKNSTLNISLGCIWTRLVPQDKFWGNSWMNLPLTLCYKDGLPVLISCRQSP